MRRFNIDGRLLWRDHRPGASRKIDRTADVLFAHDVVEERRHHNGIFTGDDKAKHRAGAFVNGNIQGLETPNEVGPTGVILPVILKRRQHGT